MPHDECPPNSNTAQPRSGSPIFEDWEDEAEEYTYNPPYRFLRKYLARRSPRWTCGTSWIATKPETKEVSLLVHKASNMYIKPTDV